MFTGIVEAVGAVLVCAPSASNKSARLQVRSGKLNLDDIKLGDSVAVNGCCLTAVEIDKNEKSLAFDVSSESLSLTNLGQLKEQDLVNLELALRVGDRLGGHQVTGHIDGLALVVDFIKNPDGSALTVKIPRQFSRYVINKGSVALNGVSLTVNRVDDQKEFSLIQLMIIPATLQKTNFAGLVAGENLNLEVDIMGKYFERLAIRQPQT